MGECTPALPGKKFPKIGFAPSAVWTRTHSKLNNMTLPVSVSPAAFSYPNLSHCSMLHRTLGPHFEEGAVSEADWGS